MNDIDKIIRNCAMFQRKTIITSKSFERLKEFGQELVKRAAELKIVGYYKKRYPDNIVIEIEDSRVDLLMLNGADLCGSSADSIVILGEHTEEEYYEARARTIMKDGWIPEAYQALREQGFLNAFFFAEYCPRIITIE